MSDSESTKEGARRPGDEAAADGAPDDASPEPPVHRCLKRVGEICPDAIEETVPGETPILRVVPERIEEVCRLLKDDPECRMTLLSNLSGVDMIALGRPDPRFDVVYHLFGLATGERVALKAAVAQDGTIPSVSGVWRTANWHEREAFDMFGIRFEGHPDLRRILMPDEFDAYPLRKDFPLEGRAKDHGYWRRPEDDERPGGEG